MCHYQPFSHLDEKVDFTIKLNTDNTFSINWLSGPQLHYKNICAYLKTYLQSTSPIPKVNNVSNETLSIPQIQKLCRSINIKNRRKGTESLINLNEEQIKLIDEQFMAFLVNMLFSPDTELKENLLQFFDKIQYNSVLIDKESLLNAIQASQQSHSHIQLIASMCKSIHDKIVN